MQVRILPPELLFNLKNPSMTVEEVNKKVLDHLIEIHRVNWEQNSDVPSDIIYDLLALVEFYRGQNPTYQKLTMREVIRCRDFLKMHINGYGMSSE